MLEPSQILEQMGVRPTAVRLLLYHALEQSDIALSLADLEELLETVDKSSISRNLHHFMEAGIIHQIQDGSGVAKYALSRLDSTLHVESHAHFTCVECGDTICLEPSPITAPQLPEGYESDHYSLVLKGTCPSCQKSK